MDIWIVIESMGDGSNALRYFRDRVSADIYMERHYEDTCYGDNPHHICVNGDFQFTEVG